MLRICVYADFGLVVISFLLRVEFSKSRIFAIFWECLKIGFDCFLYVYAGGSNCVVVSTSIIDFVEELWSFERAVKKFFELYMCSGLRVLPPS